MIGRSNPRAYSIARRIIPALGTGRPSSETATIPASFISPISASSVPSEFLVTAPIGSTLARPARSACSITNRVTAALSFTGVVFGIAHTVVNPPATAAAAPLAIVSLYSCPGSRKCTCMSMKPGATINPVASKTSALSGIGSL